MTIEGRLTQAQEQLQHWQAELRAAEEQFWLWRGMVEAYRTMLVEKGSHVLEQQADEDNGAAE